MRSIFESTRDFEAWMRKRTDVSGRLLKNKHRKMGAGAFPFLRATFYRWVERWPQVCPRLAERDEDVLLAVGDLHVENFGVWRDSRQRLVWGINDFDEACELPFTSDLVRLATSALLAAEAANLDVSANRVCALLLEGYRAGLRTEGKPILLSGGRHPALVKLTRGHAGRPEDVLEEEARPERQPQDRRCRPSQRARGHVPRLVSTPRGPDVPRAEVAGRPGQPRPAALHRRGEAEERRARRTRSQGARALRPYWRAEQDHMPSQTATLLQHAIRVPDPHFQVHDDWLVRQLAPDVAKIEMPENDRDKRLALAPALLRLMGRETANIHLGSRSREALEKLLNGLDHDELWFPTATERMAACTRKDHANWAKHSQD